MKLMLTALFGFAVAATCLGDLQPAYPTLVLDNVHLQLQHSDGSKPEFYNLPVTNGVVLDASKYQFEIPAQLKVQAPNSIQILIGRDRQYSAVWKPTNGKQLIDASNLKSLNQSKPFTGFTSGDTVVVGIGHSMVENGKIQFSVIWVGMVNIK